MFLPSILLLALKAGEHTKAFRVTKLKQQYRPHGRSIRLSAATPKPPAASRWSVHADRGVTGLPANRSCGRFHCGLWEGNNRQKQVNERVVGREGLGSCGSAGWGSWFPTHDAVKLRHGWGTQLPTTNRKRISASPISTSGSPCANSHPIRRGLAAFVRVRGVSFTN